MKLYPVGFKNEIATSSPLRRPEPQILLTKSFVPLGPHWNERFSVSILSTLDNISFIFSLAFIGTVLYPIRINFCIQNTYTLYYTVVCNTSAASPSLLFFLFHFSSLLGSIYTQVMASQAIDSPRWLPGGVNWGGLNYMLRHKSAFSSGLDPLAADATQKFMRDSCQVLVIGAGGLGCEILKDLALSGFRNLSVIDMDVIDVTNLNRQFLFRAHDVGKPKATVAANFINKRVPGSNVVAYHRNIMSFDREFYQRFNLVVCGLDSVEARRWLNAMLVDIAQVDSAGNVDHSSLIPLIDGGTEGFMGSARVIIPRLTPCFECLLNLFPPARNFPLCTIANTPRLPEHCIEYAHVVLWNKEEPFGKDQKLDTDNIDHMSWIYKKAAIRADEFGIVGVTLRLTQGVVKNIIPAVASTNAVISAACAHEALKMVTYIADNMDNYMMYNGTHGVYSLTYRNEKRPDCPVCGVPTVKHMSFPGTKTLSEYLDVLAADTEIQSRNPFLRTTDGRTLFASSPEMLRKATQQNLSLPMSELLSSGTRITLTDKSLPMPRSIELTLT